MKNQSYYSCKHLRYEEEAYYIDGEIEENVYLRCSKFDEYIIDSEKCKNCKEYEEI